ncbi:phage replisome organizer N-terminal domain-containing protein [Aerococcus christensenii]|uniref:phage replisome organizer N-terminal domain-containing protein n=1 Tax=Aerococcus christensenii TaxID=87541 RepID=UPI003F4205BF
MSEKQYYWLKLYDDFFDDDTMTFIEEQENGKEYLLFYLKLCLKSLKDDGKLIKYVGNSLIPYSDKALAKLTNTRIEIVTEAIKLFKRIGLITITDLEEIFMTQVEEMTGRETRAASRMRKHRVREKAKEKNGRNIVQSERNIVRTELQGECNNVQGGRNNVQNECNNVTDERNVVTNERNIVTNERNIVQSKRNNVQDERNIVQKCYIEIEKEIDIDKEKDKDIEREKDKDKDKEKEKDKDRDRYINKDIDINKDKEPVDFELDEDIRTYAQICKRYPNEEDREKAFSKLLERGRDYLSGNWEPKSKEEKE